MTTLQALPQRTGSTTLSPPSKDDLQEMVARMMGPGEWTQRTTLISPSEAQAIIESIERRDGMGSKLLVGEALASAKRMMGMFPAKAFNDPEVFAEALAALLSAYDKQFVTRVMSPVDGVATRIKFALTLADVKEALEAEKNKRLSIFSVARWTLQEHKRREEECLDREFKLTPEQAENRRRQVATLRGPRNMADGEGVKLEADDATAKI